jgi:putative transposase
VFIGRLWRSVKYEGVYLRDYTDGWQAEDLLSAHFHFYNEERIRQALGYRTPRDIYRETDSSGSEPPDEKRIEIARKKYSWLVHQKVKLLPPPRRTWRGPRGRQPYTLFRLIPRPNNGVHFTSLLPSS